MTNKAVESFAFAFKNSALERFDVNIFNNALQCKTFESAFEGCSKLGSFGYLGGQTVSYKPTDESLATNFKNVFKNCVSLDKLAVDIFDTCKNAEVFESAFEGCEKFKYDQFD
jgi:hypothetical protein